MSRLEFEALVRRIEQATAGHPGRLRVQTAAWTLLGFSVFLSLLGLVWLAGGALIAGGITATDHFGNITILLGVGVLVLGSARILKYFKACLTPPEGIVISESMASKLHAEISQLRGALLAKPVHRILLTSEVNAAVCEIPRFGIFGRPRSYLMIGLPLMDELTPDEFRAVLAHEMAHLSGRHGRFSNWIYRVRRTWEQVFERLAESGSGHRGGGKVLRWFMTWYWPRFNARAFVLSRLCEYEADAAAARWTSPEDVTTGLLRIKMLQPLVDGPVQEVLRQQAAASSVPSCQFTELLKSCRIQQDQSASLGQWCREALLIPTGHNDTHPSLGDRMAAIKAGPACLPAPGGFPQPAMPDAASYFLEEDLSGLRRAVDALWIKDAASSWAARHASSADLSRSADVLGTSGKTVDLERLWDEAKTTEFLHGSKAAAPLLERLLEQYPQHFPAGMALARHWLNHGEPDRAEVYLNRIMDRPDGDHEVAAELLHLHYRRSGQTGKLQELLARLDVAEKNREAAARERAEVNAANTFKPHTLTDAETAPLLALLTQLPGLSRAVLAEKLLLHRVDQRMFVLCIHGKGGFMGMGSQEPVNAAIRFLTAKLQLPGRTLIIAARGPLGAIARKINSQKIKPVWTADQPTGP